MLIRLLGFKRRKKPASWGEEGAAAKILALTSVGSQGSSTNRIQDTELEKSNLLKIPHEH